MTEPDVVITDLVLTIEAALFSLLLWRSGSADSDFRLPFVVFFAATAIAALTGAAVHGFFTGSHSRMGMALWRLTLLALGIVALATWVIAARLLLSASAARVLETIAAAIALGYAVIIVAVNDSFSIAIAHYVPPTLFLLVAFAALYHRDHQSSALAGLLGLVLTLLAAVVQQRRIAPHAVYFNHNALYHAIQAVALFLIFRSARELV